jgi:hypothetical protein
VLQHIAPGADLIVPLANGEPVAVLDAIEAHGVSTMPNVFRPEIFLPAS